MTGTVSALFGRVALVMVLAVNILAASFFFVHERRGFAAAGSLMEATGQTERAPVLAAAVNLAVSSSDAAKFAVFACVRDLLIVEHSSVLENALLRMSLPAYPMPYPSPRGDYASVFLSNQEFVENARAGRIAAIAPEVLTREIAGSRALLFEALRNDAGSVVLRTLAGLLANNSHHGGSNAFHASGRAAARAARLGHEAAGSRRFRRQDAASPSRDSHDLRSDAFQASGRSAARAARTVSAAAGSRRSRRQDAAAPSRDSHDLRSDAFQASERAASRAARLGHEAAGSRRFRRQDAAAPVRNSNSVLENAPPVRRVGCS